MSANSASLSEGDLQRAICAYQELRKGIREERVASAEFAKVAFQNQDERKLQKRFAHEEITRVAKSMRAQGSTILTIAIALGKSERTIYRYIGRESDGEGTALKAK